MSEEQRPVTPLLQRIHAEYKESPGLHLTKPQMQRLWGLDAPVCNAAVEALVHARVLRPTNRGAYVLLGSGR